jgi:hypothetical protein
MGLLSGQGECFNLWQITKKICLDNNHPQFTPQKGRPLQIDIICFENGGMS